MAASSDAATFWLIGIPNSANEGKTRSSHPESQWADDKKLVRRHLNDKTQKYSHNFDFNLPRLKVGTLDSLMQLSDDLGKIDQTMEATVMKIKRNYEDLKNEDALRVDEKSINAYCENFQWNAAKYPPDSTLQTLVEKIHSELLAMDEDLKKRLGKFTEVSQTLTAIERKEQGSLVVRPLGKLVEVKDMIEGEYLTSLIIVVPVAREDEFLKSYETLEQLAAEAQKKKDEEAKARDEQRGKKGDAGAAAAAADAVNNQEEKKLGFNAVVPRSHKKLYDKDPEFVLYRVVVMRKGKDSYSRLCQEKRYTVRTIQHDAKQQDKLEEQRKLELINERDKLLGELTQYCRTYYSEVFVGWIHLKAIRIFVESVLRYGIPVNFQAVLIRPVKGYRAKLRKVLLELYGPLAGSDFSSTDTTDASTAALEASGVGEFYPYVFLTISLDDSTDTA